MNGPEVILAVSVALLVAAVVFYVRACRTCAKAIATLAEARRIHESVDRQLEKNLDTVARVEEFTC